MKTISGSGMSDFSAVKIALAVSEFNSEVTEKLLAGALETLSQKKIDKKNILIVKVPGAFELPFICKKIALTKNYDAVVALGAVIRGDTYHYELVCNQAAAGILKASYETDVPVLFGVITSDNEEQAHDRAGGKEGNKGSDAVLAALQMIGIMREL